MCKNGVSSRKTPLRCERRRVFWLGGQACSLRGHEIQAIGQEGPEPQATGDRACSAGVLVLERKAVWPIPRTPLSTVPQVPYLVLQVPRKERDTQRILILPGPVIISERNLSQPAQRTCRTVRWGRSACARPAGLLF